MEKLLPGQPLRESDYADMRRQLLDLFVGLVFKPVFSVLDALNAEAASVAAKLEITNAAGSPGVALKEALRSGRVQYGNGIFSGKFSSAITRELRALGAVFDKRERVYKLDLAKVPDFAKAEAALYQAKAKKAYADIKRKLNEIEANLPDIVGAAKINALPTTERIESGWKKSARALEVMPELTPGARHAMADAYSTNMKLWVKKFSKEMIVDLRQTVEQNARQGYRFDKLVDGIKSKYKTTDSKAKFLAAQETRIFMSEFREQRFSQAGVTEYVWDGTMDIRERKDHKLLQGRRFSYANPPIVDRATGRRANPGKDYGCRCIDRPILREAVSA